MSIDNLITGISDNTTGIRIDTLKKMIMTFRIMNQHSSLHKVVGIRRMPSTQKVVGTLRVP